MRRVGLMDLHHAARAVQVVPEDARLAFVGTLLWRAHVADKYVRHFSSIHPAWGDGSLRAAAQAHPQAPYGLPGSADLRRCYLLVLEALERRDHGNLAQAGR